ncbi:7337_t:CDS:2 [Scutellospora calospora]|uniref:7337_t:CDS:1 n=1 Tax=Scutellospora calospora TaxID=85575 RepID=A0ACA9K4P9_9GLOM|nr:7337_t:CDS:2 [Scutellospora calospora]
MLKGSVEIDETYVGDKTPVLIMEERGGNAIAQVVSDVKQKTLEPIIRKYVKEGINHKKKQYVKGKARVALIENFNSHLKRGIQGTYHWGIMVIAKEVRIALQRLKLIERLILHRETPWLLSADDKKIKDDDSQVIKMLKKAVKPETRTVGTQTETIYLLTPQEKEALDKEIENYNKKPGQYRVELGTA